MDEPFEAEVMALTRETIARCARLLDLTDVTVVLLPESPENAFVLERMGGVAGLTVGAGVVVLRVAPTTSWQPFVVDAVAHELHHASWVHTRDDVDRTVDLSLVEAVVMEGRACVFARELQPDFVAPWTRALTEMQARNALGVVGEVLRGKQTVDAGAFLFGGHDFAPWTGYDVGTRMVQAFRARFPDMSWRDMTRLDAMAVALGSGALP
ncbi:DUF2268 domain-containing putative Zn-dependent protease [Deinococcus malanensis]|uniref:DUF2268 domain-containing putative Zn-dependent protease n=1 Tax=Deinococcus malanensis TaxID=1706855 RepID=UPI001668C710|nr:DUF2268 domain-containing putative Zn-dependent protease [Deinococcus malanensis]